MHTKERSFLSLSKWSDLDTLVGLISKSSEEVVAQELRTEMEAAQQTTLETHLCPE